MADLPSNARVVIVGGGIVGCSVAYHLALRGVTYRPAGASQVLLRNLLVYGIGGVIVPFVGIKLIDMVVAALGLA